jgi:hypothetical protein
MLIVNLGDVLIVAMVVCRKAWLHGAMERFIILVYMLLNLDRNESAKKYFVLRANNFLTACPLAVNSKQE